MTDSKYKTGEVWNYKTRDGETKSRIYIARIDTIEKYGNIYHISVDNLNIKNKHIKSGIQTVLPHIPVSQEALDASVTNLTSNTQNIPDITEGYNEWKKDSGGVFTISISKIIQYIEDIVNN
ncbi:MAG: hypothetical protein WCT36_01190 [Candidatus Gracilibacteria bacterium]|jgi:hypothetical protein